MIAAILPVIGQVLDRILPDKKAAEAAKQELARQYFEGDLEALRLDVELAKGQLAVNQQEAQHSSVFVAGWRPGLGWLSVCGLGWSFIAQPLLAWVATINGIEPPPRLDTGDLMTLTLGMLGLGGMRSYERLRGVSRSSLGVR
jgi:hypothetical protein